MIEFRFYFDMKCVLDKLDGIEINGRNIRFIEDKLRISYRCFYFGSRFRLWFRRRFWSRSCRSSCSRF